jgi:hypothetical protein
MSEQRETRGAGSAGHERTGASGPDRRADAAPQDALVIVGIGASAGGLEAFRLLLGALPPDTGMASCSDPSRPSCIGARSASCSPGRGRTVPPG